MTIVQLDDAVAAALSAQASHQGLSLEGFLAQVAKGSMQDTQPDLSSDEFDRILKELSHDVPLLPPDFSRADIYLDHA